MANASRVNQNRDVIVAGIELTQQASGGFLTTSGLALVNISGTFTLRTQGGGYWALAAESISIPIDLASCTSGQIPVRQFPRTAGVLTAADWQTTKPPTTSGRSTVIQLGIGSGSMSGGVFNLHYSGMATLGTRVAATALTGSNSFTASGELTATVTSVGASGALAEGAGVITLYYTGPA